MLLGRSQERAVSMQIAIEDRKGCNGAIRQEKTKRVSLRSEGKINEVKI